MTRMSIKSPNIFTAIDLFSGCGGSAHGMKKAGFKIELGCDISKDAKETYVLNFPEVTFIHNDIRNVSVHSLKKKIGPDKIHLLSGCPPCQGFSTMRTKNSRVVEKDSRNTLIRDYFRIVKGLKPYTIFFENVVGIEEYYLFKKLIRDIRKLGYDIDFKVLDFKDYGLPQRRKRLILVGSLLGPIKIISPIKKRVTVRDAIGKMQSPKMSKDFWHKTAVNHSDKINELIKLIPKDGGSRKSLPKRLTLDCHKVSEIGFSDVYGRMQWDKEAPTITSGCLNPSKGRFLHPSEDRVITAREAATLQSFPKEHRFPKTSSKQAIASMIGNAVPPMFVYKQSLAIKKHIAAYLESNSIL